MKLYEISQMYQDTLDDIDSEDENSLEAINSIEVEFEDKAIAVISHFKNLEADAVAIKEEENKMKARRLSIEKNVAWLKNYLLNNMIETGINKITCPYFEVKLKTNPASTIIVDESLIPDEFKTEVRSVKIDKTAIKKAGGCDGAKLIRKQSLSIN